MKVKFHQNLLLAALVNSIIGEVGLFLSPAINYFQPFIMPMANRSISKHYGATLNDASYAWVWSSLAAADTIGNLLASAMLFYMIEKLGSRNVVLVVRNTLSSIACVFLALAGPTSCVEFIFAGRFLTGFCGACSNVMFIYLSECIPDNFRGTMSMILGLGGGAWVMLATVIALPQVLGNERLWPVYFVLPIIPNLIHTAFVFVFPRSPKFLYITKQDQKAAIKSVKFYYGKNVPVENVLEKFDHEAILALDGNGVSYRRIFKTHHLFRPFLICIFATLSGIFNGQQIAQQYSNAILVMLGVPQDKSMVVILSINLFASGLGIANTFYLIEHVGRRKMQLINVGIAILGMFCVFVANLANPQHSVEDRGNLASMGMGVIGFLCVSFSNALGIESIPKLLVGELCPQSTRGKTASATYVIGNIVSFIQVIAWPPLEQAIGAYSFLPLVVGEIVCFTFLFYYLPETKNRPVDEIVAQWCNEVAMDTGDADLAADSDQAERSPLLKQDNFDYGSAESMKNGAQKAS